MWLELYVSSICTLWYIPPLSLDSFSNFKISSNVFLLLLTLAFLSGLTDEVINVDDIVETANHFRCIDLIIDKANLNVTENLIKQLHLILKNGTTDSRKNWFVVGDYKKLPNEVGGRVTTSPEKVEDEVKSLIVKLPISAK